MRLTEVMLQVRLLMAEPKYTVKYGVRGGLGGKTTGTISSVIRMSGVSRLGASEDYLWQPTPLCDKLRGVPTAHIVEAGQIWQTWPFSSLVARRFRPCWW